MTRIISPREDVKLLAVSVPEDATNFDIEYEAASNEEDPDIPLLVYDLWVGGDEPYGNSFCQLPPGDYIPLGIATELPEEVTRELVKAHLYPMTNDIMGYEDYQNGWFHVFDDSNGSFASFLRREGITERVYVLKVKEGK